MESLKGFSTCVILFYFYLVITLVFKGLLDYPMVGVVSSLLNSYRINNERQSMLTNLQFDVRHYELIADNIKTSDPKNTEKIRLKIVNYSERIEEIQFKSIIQGDLKRSIENAGGSDYEQTLQWKSRIRGNEFYYKEIQIDEALYQIIANNDIMSYSPIELLKRYNETPDNINLVRGAFHRVNDNIIQAISPQFDVMRTKLDDALVTQNRKKIEWLNIYQFCTIPGHFIIFLIVLTFIKRLAKNESQLIKYFSLVDFKHVERALDDVIEYKIRMIEKLGNSIQDISSEALDMIESRENQKLTADTSNYSIHFRANAQQNPTKTTIKKQMSTKAYITPDAQPKIKQKFLKKEQKTGQRVFEKAKFKTQNSANPKHKILAKRIDDKPSIQGQKTLSLTQENFSRQKTIFSTHINPNGKLTDLKKFAQSLFQ